MEFKNGTHISELSKLINRSEYGIALKMRNLSKEFSNTWNPKEVRDYTKEIIKKNKGSKGDIKSQKKRWRMKNRSERVVAREKFINEIDWHKFVNYLTNYLEEGDFSKKEFSFEMGIHPSLLSHYLAGRRTPSCEFFEKMSEKSEIPYENFKKAFEFV